MIRPNCTRPSPGSFFAAIGQPSNRASYAWVTVHIGDDIQEFGLYLLLETWNGDWQERNFGTREGNLYEGGYPYYPESYNHADFTPQEAANFELEYGVGDENASLITVARTLGKPTADWATRAATVLDLPTFADYYVGEAWTGHWDGYICATNNFRVRETGGTVQVLPSGLDWTFTEGASWSRPNSALGTGCYRDLSCKALVQERAAAICDTLDVDALLAEFDRLQALIEPYTQKETRPEYDARSLSRNQQGMRSWMSTRCDLLSSQL